MSQNPDIRVRLAPEGVREVVEALKRVQREGDETARRAAGGVNILGSALASFKRLLPAIGLGAVVAATVGFGRNALRTADEIGKMGESVGAASENVSALVFASRMANLTQQELQQGLVRTRAALRDLRRGADEQVEAFAEIGLSADNFIGKDTAEAFALIAERLVRVEDAGRRADLAMAIFGDRIGPKLVPLLNDVGNVGLPAVIEAARRAGQLMGGDLTDAAKAAFDSMDTVRQQAGGLATQFIDGFAPAISAAMKNFEGDVGDKGGNTMRSFGETAGRVLRGVAGLFAFLARTSGGALDILGRNAAAFQLAAEKTMSGEPGKALDILTTRSMEVRGEWRDLFKQLNTDWDKFKDEISKDPPKLQPPPRPADNGSGGPLDTVRETAQRVAELNKRLGADQLQQLSTLAARRRELVDQEAAAELRRLEARAAADQDNIRSREAVERAELESLRRRTDAAARAYALDVELANVREKALIDLAKRQEGTAQQRIRTLATLSQQATQERIAASQAYYKTLSTLEDEYRRRATAARQQIKALDTEVTDNAKRAVDIIKSARLAGLTQEQQIAQHLADAREQEINLRSAVLAGDLKSAREIRAESERTAQALASAGKFSDAERILERANDLYKTGADAQKLGLTKVASESEKTADKIAKDLQAVYERLSFLLVSFVGELANMKIGVNDKSIQDVINKIRDEIGRAPFDIAVTPRVVMGAAFGGPIPALASGGRVPGRSPSPHADNILMWGTAGEFMQPVRAVKYYGTDFMESIRRMELPRFAAGGLVGGGGDTGGGDVVNVNLNIGGRTVRMRSEREQVQALVDALAEVGRGT